MTETKNKKTTYSATISITDHRGIVVDEFDLAEYLRSAEREFPDDDRETHVALAFSEMADNVKSSYFPDTERGLYDI